VLLGETRRSVTLGDEARIGHTGILCSMAMLDVRLCSLAIYWVQREFLGSMNLRLPFCKLVVQFDCYCLNMSQAMNLALQCAQF
jgi:hypothetical protein